MYPVAFQNLIDSLKHLPGVGTKSAERYAFDILKYSQEDLDKFVESLIGVANIKYCRICGNISDDDVCTICNDHTRDTSTIIVVESAKDVIAIEKTNEYHGLYHVLNGAISTNKGILPEDLNIKTLIERLDDHIKEVIVATDPTIEGETTALYLAKLLANKGVVSSRLAHGLPMGGHLDYADELTLIKAIEGRKKL